jgi:fructose 1,6-bisphosphatase
MASRLLAAVAGPFHKAFSDPVNSGGVDSDMHCGIAHEISLQRALRV